MQEQPNTQRSLGLSYIGLRRMIGIIGIMLPYVLFIGKMILESPGVLGSISAYYYSVMKDVYVDSMCATAVFLLSYRYDRLDDIAGDIAGVSAIGVAYFPTPPAVGATEQQVIIGRLHLVFVACFFGERIGTGCQRVESNRETKSICSVGSRFSSVLRLCFLIYSCQAPLGYNHSS